MFCKNTFVSKMQNIQQDEAARALGDIMSEFFESFIVTEKNN